jgi:hypothetical protein
MPARQHRFRITVEHIAAPREGEPLQPPLTFEAGNHDDILRIAGRMRARSGFPPDDAAALAIGMKLFSEVMLMNRDDPLFAELRPHMRQFVGALKARNRANEDEASATA